MRLTIWENGKLELDVTIDPARYLYGCPKRRGMSKRMQKLWLQYVAQSQPVLYYSAAVGAWIDPIAMWRARLRWA